MVAILISKELEELLFLRTCSFDSIFFIFFIQNLDEDVCFRQSSIFR